MTEDEMIEILIEVARHSPNAAARISAIKTLRQIGPERPASEDDIYPPDELTRKRAVTRGRR